MLPQTLNCGLRIGDCGLKTVQSTLSASAFTICTLLNPESAIRNPQSLASRPSFSIAITLPTRAASTRVSVPVPAPISTTTSSGAGSSAAAMRSRMRGSVRKCCPRDFRARGSGTPSDSRDQERPVVAGRGAAGECGKVGEDRFEDLLGAAVTQHAQVREYALLPETLSRFPHRIHDSVGEEAEDIFAPLPWLLAICGGTGRAKAERRASGLEPLGLPGGAAHQEGVWMSGVGVGADALGGIHHGIEERQVHLRPGQLGGERLLEA